MHLHLQDRALIILLTSALARPTESRRNQGENKNEEVHDCSGDTNVGGGTSGAELKAKSWANCKAENDAESEPSARQWVDMK